MNKTPLTAPLKDITPASFVYTKTELTRVYNKNYAPSGKIYLVVKAKRKDKAASAAQLVDINISDEDRNATVQTLKEFIVKQYNL